MCRHVDLMVEVFWRGTRLSHVSEKSRPWYAKRFGPASEFNKRVVQVSNARAGFSRRAGTLSSLASAIPSTGDGELQPKFQPAPLVASFMREPAVAQREQIPVPRGPVEVW